MEGLRRTRQGAGLVGLAESFVFRAAGRTYVFAKWQPDNECHYGCCTHNYSLFEVGDRLIPKADTAYGCDI